MCDLYCMTIVPLLTAAGEYAGRTISHSLWRGAKVGAKAAALWWWYTDTAEEQATQSNTYVYEVPSSTEWQQETTYGSQGSNHYSQTRRRPPYEGPLGPPQIAFRPAGTYSWWWWICAVVGLCVLACSTCACITAAVLCSCGGVCGAGVTAIIAPWIPRKVWQAAGWVLYQLRGVLASPIEVLSRHAAATVQAGPEQVREIAEQMQVPPSVLLRWAAEWNQVCRGPRAQPYAVQNGPEYGSTCGPDQGDGGGSDQARPGLNYGDGHYLLQSVVDQLQRQRTPPGTCLSLIGPGPVAVGSGSNVQLGDGVCSVGNGYGPYPAGTMAASSTQHAHAQPAVAYTNQHGDGRRDCPVVVAPGSPHNHED